MQDDISVYREQGENFFDDQEVLSNAELEEELGSIEGEKTVVYSRDWTIGTIYTQIDQGNIDLNPKFQRRNAWKDDKKSKLIESYILGLPVPEIVLAEDPKRPRAFIVIDGKQRLLTIAGFINPGKYPYWQEPKIRGLKSKERLNGYSYELMKANPLFADSLRLLMNADNRCTVVSHFKNDDVLYDIFYRLNTGSVPLSSQELRQVLNKGPFADYLYSVTQDTIALQQVMGLEGSDPRLYDVEFILRYVVFSMFGKEYTNNLKQFLDDSMKKVNEDWGRHEKTVKDLVESIDYAIGLLRKVFNDTEIGRRYVKDRYFGRFNKAVLESQLYYFARLNIEVLTDAKNKQFKEEFEKVSLTNESFGAAVSGSTKDLEKFRARHTVIRDLVNLVYGLTITDIPVKFADTATR